MITTTVLVAVQFKYVKGFSPWFGLLFFLTFGFFDGETQLSIVCAHHGSFVAFVLPSSIGLFWGAALRKIPHGAWVPLMIGVILYVCPCVRDLVPRR